MRIVQGIYRHIKSLKIFKVHSIARNHLSPTNYIVVYSQEYDDILRDSKSPVKLPKGTMWARDLKDFESKFEPVK